MTIVEFSEELKVLNVTPKRMFKAMVIDGHNLLPKIIPHMFKSIDVVQGEGGTSGCVRRISFPDGSQLTDKFKDVDTEKLMLKVDVFDWPMFGEKLETIQTEKMFQESGDGGSIIKWKTQLQLKPGYTHVSDEEINSLKQLSISFITETQAYLVAHLDVCA
ncbi:major pollen allergen Car b 1-like [Henckelia pumila]|uniref:major pollen allergen Car b 1-like n=1 Tax=Henckelia pumila TaxID=405737 RepID=UPI003C6E5C01